MNTPPSKRYFKNKNTVTLAALAALTLLYTPNLIQHTIALAVLTATGTLIVRKLTPKADTLEQLTAGTLLGTTTTTLILYTLNMTLNIKITLPLTATILLITAITTTQIKTKQDKKTHR
jgi:phosphatidylserine synthase